MCHLSEPQRALLSKQRTRIAHIAHKKDSDQESSCHDKGKELLGEYSYQDFKKAVDGFEPSDRFERRLVLGVLFKDRIVPR